MTTITAPPAGPLDSAAEEFVNARPRLLGIARRILRDPVEAEDIVQDAWIRWQGADRGSVANPQAFLTTTTTRLALNQAQCARRRRECPAGSCLRDLPTPAEGPEPCAERREGVELAVSVMLAKLNPNQRAAYVLREAFGYEYERIADLLELSPANCRQLVRRARRSLVTSPHRPVSAAARRRLHRAFVAAAQDGDFEALEHLLAASAASRTFDSTVQRPAC